MAGPLDGVRVAEITQFQQGPVAGMRLGDLGANVIKVEPKTGDPARGMMRAISILPVGVTMSSSGVGRISARMRWRASSPHTPR